MFNNFIQIESFCPFFDNHLNFNRFVDSAGPTVNNKKDTSLNLNQTPIDIITDQYQEYIPLFKTFEIDTNKS